MTDPRESIGRRRSLGRAFAEMHYRLRAGTDPPARTAFAVWLGIAIGCTPLYGFHLPMCLALGALFRLSLVKCYLAAHVNNPLTAPFLLYLEAVVGRTIVTGEGPSLGFRAWKEAGLLAVGRDIVVGSLVLGVVLGAALAVVAYLISSRWRTSSSRQRLIERVARPYLGSGVLSWEFVRGKLRYDPVYLSLLAGGLLPARGRLVDLGCGRGILLALLDTVKDMPDESLPDSWPEPPRGLGLAGVDASPRAVAVARGALGERADLSVADLRDYRPPPCDAVVLLDVLHYLGADDQEHLLSRVAERLHPGGTLVVREADASGGLRFLLTRLSERVRALGRGSPGQRFHYRTRAEWARLLDRRGLAVESRPMSRGTPFANALILGSASGDPARPGTNAPVRLR